MIDGKFNFQDAYKNAEKVKLINEVSPILSYQFLIENKITARRPKDLEDIRQLELRRGNDDSKKGLGF